MLTANIKSVEEKSIESKAGVWKAEKPDVVSYE